MTGEVLEYGVRWDGNGPIGALAVEVMCIDLGGGAALCKQFFGTVRGRFTSLRFTVHSDENRMVS